MNIVPGLHLALVSIPKLADAGYTTVFNKDGAAMYDNETTQITATSPLVLELERYEHTRTKIFAFSHVHGHHDYMKKPFAPLGCAIKAHIKPEDHRTWDTRSDAGFNLCTSMQHHRCFCVYIMTTRATRISDTFFSSTSISPTRQSHRNPTSLRQPSNLQWHSKAISWRALRRQRHLKR